MAIQTRHGMRLTLLGIALSASAVGTLAHAAPMEPGDILAGIGRGKVRHIKRNGTWASPLPIDTGTNSYEMTGSCFMKGVGNNLGNWLTTAFTTNQVIELTAEGMVQGLFGSGYNTHPNSCTVKQKSGHVFIGVADLPTPQIRQYNSQGNLLGTFSPTTGPKGPKWIDLEPTTQCTMYYSSEGPRLRRFDVCTNQQLADFATSPTFQPFYQVRIRKNGDVVVAGTSAVYRYSKAGALLNTYRPAGLSMMTSVELDPDDTSLLIGDYNNGKIARMFVDDQERQMVTQTIQTMPLTALSGMAVVPGPNDPPCLPICNCKPDHTVSTNDGCQAFVDINGGSTDCNLEPLPPGSCTQDQTNLAAGTSSTVSLTCTTPAGSCTCMTQVAVRDGSEPQINCPADQGQEYECIDRGADASFSPTAVDNCDPNPRIECTPESGSRFGLGSTAVTCTATDASGNAASCGFSVSVVDTTGPTIISQPYDLFEDEDLLRDLEKASGKCEPVIPFQISDCVASATDQCLGPLDPNSPDFGRITRIEWWPNVSNKDMTKDQKSRDKMMEHWRKKFDKAGCDLLQITGPDTADLPFDELDDPHNEASAYKVFYQVNGAAGSPGTEAVCTLRMLGRYEDLQKIPLLNLEKQPTPLGCGVCIGAGCGACPAPEEICTKSFRKPCDKCERLMNACTLNDKYCETYQRYCVDQNGDGNVDQCDRIYRTCQSEGRYCDKYQQYCTTPAGGDKCAKYRDDCLVNNKYCSSYSRYCKDENGDGMVDKCDGYIASCRDQGKYCDKAQKYCQ